MRIFVDSDNPDILEALRQVKGHTEIRPFAFGMQETYGEDDVLIVSIERADFKSMIELRRLHPEAHLFYWVSLFEDAREANRLHSLCAAYNIRLIPPARSHRQIAETVGRLFDNADSAYSRVIAAFGTVGGLGVTSSLLLFGKSLAETYDVRVGVLGLNGLNPGTTLLPYQGKFLDEIWGAIEGRQVRRENLLEKFDMAAPNLFYLAGNRDLLKVYTYTPEGIGYLIELARAQFDIVLLDIGHCLDTPMAVQGILAADFLWVYANQSLYARETFFRMKEQILERELGVRIDRSNNVWLLCNGMYGSADVETSDQLQKIFGIPCVASMPYLPTFYRFEQRKNLLTLSERRYMRELERPLTAVASFYKLTSRETRMPSRGLFRLGRA